MNDQNPWMRAPKAPPAHIAYAHKLGRGMLTFEQIEELVKAINPAYVDKKQKLTYLAQHQARAEMNRIFGYGNWSVDAEDAFLLYETQQAGKDGKERWVVAYRIRVTVEIRDYWGMPVASYTGVHAEENAPQPNRGEAHALALTSVDSYALRRALINLGDRFGLGLYNGGSTAPHGQYTSQLQPGILYDWKSTEQQAPAAPAAVPAQPTHETIQAEPVISDDGTRPEAPADGGYAGAMRDQGAEQPRGRTPEMQQFNEIQQGMQQQRQAERQQQLSPEMQARLQQGLKTDGV